MRGIKRDLLLQSIGAINRRAFNYELKVTLQFIT